MEFTKWWTTEFKTIKFPAQGTVFDYYIDNETHKFEPWTKMVEKFQLDPDLPLQVSVFVIFILHAVKPVALVNDSDLYLKKYFHFLCT